MNNKTADLEENKMTKLNFDESKLINPGELSFQEVGGINFLGLTLTGKSHLEKGKVCQDANYVRFTNKNHPTVVAAIADGVGSCALSNYGSSIAVKVSTNYLTSVFKKLDISNTDDKEIGEHIRTAMQKALDAIEEEANINEQLPYSYQTTLTLAMYDGNNLYYGHIGDDGIVALTSDGKLSMITTRIKGDEANSVYPLQAGKNKWEVGKCIEPVDGFMMATDGILDSIVMSEKQNNRVYYPFMEPAFKGTDNIEIGKLYAKTMQDSNFRKKVTDDMTVVFVKNERVKNNPYRFDAKKWNDETEYYEKQLAEALYSTPTDYYDNSHKRR